MREKREATQKEMDGELRRMVEQVTGRWVGSLLAQIDADGTAVEVFLLERD